MPTIRPGKIIKASTINDIPTYQKKLTQPEKVVEYIKTHKKIAGNKISKAVSLSSHGAEILGYLETNGIIKGTVCECGKDKLYELVKYDKKS